MLSRFQFPYLSTAERLATIINADDIVRDSDTGQLYIGDGVTLGGNPVGVKGDKGEPGSVIAKQVEVDFGVNSVIDGVFNITDVDISISSKVIGNKALKSPSDGRDVDEIFCESLDISAKCNVGSLDLYIASKCGRVSGKFLINYFIG